MLKHIFLIFLICFVAVVILSFKFYEKRIYPNYISKVCLITGASSGVGREIAKEMVARGWKVIGIARRLELLNELKKELGENNFIPYICDVADKMSVQKVSNDIKAKGLKPTLFFLNAGVGELEKTFEFNSDIHKKTFDINYFGVINWVEQWLNNVKEYGGGIFIATSSVASILGVPHTAAYATSKAALNSCFNSLRLEYLNLNIGFSLIILGPVDTDMLKGDGAKNMPFIQTPKKAAEYIVKKVFKGKKQIHNYWFYSSFLTVLSWFPDQLVLKILGTDKREDNKN